MLIAWGLVTRAATNNNFKLVYDTRKAMKKKQVAAAKVGRKAEAKQWKKAQLIGISHCRKCQYSLTIYQVVNSHSVQ